MAAAAIAAEPDFATPRRAMVDRQLVRRGIRDKRVLEAMGEVPREAFLPEHLAEFAYMDTPLPIGSGQTISQPYIVARMLEALDLEPADRVLEIGAGSGYAAAVLSRIARDVFAVERHAGLADEARERCAKLGYDNVHILHGDGTLGWPEHAPFAGIVVAAGGPSVPSALREQLAPGGCLVIPVESERGVQELTRLRRTDSRFERENLGAVRFVPLIGAQGWAEQSGPAGGGASASQVASTAVSSQETAHPLRDAFEGFDDIDTVDLAPLLERIGASRLVLIGEASHGTSEFYRMRARITRELIEQRGFDIVAIEADWPDAAQVDRYVTGRDGTKPAAPAFARFPTWMWRNEEVREFVDWLHDHNERLASNSPPVNFYGLDLYSLHASADEVLRYLDEIDPQAAEVARLRYGCLTPWEQDPVMYGRMAFTEGYGLCENEVVSTLRDLLDSRLDYERHDGEEYLDAAQNARLVANAEGYYRAMYRGAAESWNLRDRHMFEVLQAVLEFRGRQAKAVVWAHNSHLGDASATQMSASGELNVGQLAREKYGRGAYLIGFGTHCGTVAAASTWGGEMERKTVRASHADSYERLCHDAGVPRFLLPLRDPLHETVRDALREPRLERAIGVIYRPETELASHYFEAELARQFDEYIWFDESSAITPLGCQSAAGLPETYPFGV